MINWFINLDHTYQAALAGLFTYSITALGAAIVFLFKKINKSFMDAMLGFSGGVMIAASFWSLLSPAIEMANNLNLIAWLVVLIGFLSGGLLLFTGDKIFDKLDKIKKYKDNKFKRSLMLIFSITLHNIPEGLAVGVAFGSIAYNLEGASILNACILAFGIGLQNFPEGTAISVPLRREGFSRKKAFFYGQLSGLVEPLSALLGASLVLLIRGILPFVLCFAAGAMIYVVAEELIPSAKLNSKEKMGTLGVLLGFAIMMVLDIALS